MEKTCVVKNKSETAGIRTNRNATFLEPYFYGFSIAVFYSMLYEKVQLGKLPQTVKGEDRSRGGGGHTKKYLDLKLPVTIK